MSPVETTLKRAPWGVRAGGVDTDVEPSTYHALDARVIRARESFPGSRFLLAALVEEVGELALALVSRDADAIRNEALDVACVAVRIVEEGDQTEYHNGRFIELVVTLGELARRFLEQKGVWVPQAAFKLASLAHLVGEIGDHTFDDVTKEESKP